MRVYEIPLVGPGFDVEELTRPVPAEEKETLALYERAIELQRQATPRTGRGGRARLHFSTCPWRVGTAEGRRAGR